MAEVSPRTRVVVVDDHALLRQGVVAAIGTEVDVVGEADDVASGIAEIRARVPDVVLLDVHLPSGSGAEIIAALRDELPDVQYLALSVSDAPDDVLGLVRAGARGYVTKRIDGHELVAAIGQVAAGNAVFSPRLAGFVLDAFTGTGVPSVPVPGRPAVVEPGGLPDPGHDEELDRLSAREREVMQHLARGYAYKEIAAELFISVRTVESHASAVLRKLQLSSRNELAHWASQKRLL
ncbi:MAG: two component transcriptional regulator, LuxR family [Acidimicrobiales bacterium]|nr:two component transcriptional regulator, LuxR family [Acidimicrobiales bacterium]